jgi:ComF family protein
MLTNHLSAARILNPLAPHCCEICKLPSERALRLCSDCQASVFLFNRHCCPRCALPLEGTGAVRECGRCLQQEPVFERTIAPCLYQPPLDKLINGVKHNRDVTLIPVLVELMVTDVESRLFEQGAPDCLLPMPLHWRRQLRRGFNQAELLAQRLARHPRLQAWNLRVERLCSRRRATPPQQGLDRLQRQRNLRNAFGCKHLLNGQHLVIVDDVLTTGASVNQLASLLRDSGAARVDVWCCARTPAPTD